MGKYKSILFKLCHQSEDTVDGILYLSQRFEVLMVVNMMITAFLDVTPCSLVEKYLHFGETYCLHLSDRRVILMIKAVGFSKTVVCIFQLII
jgi:hypothetical protein